MKKFYVIILLLAILQLRAADLDLNQFAVNLQFFARNGNNQSIIPITGKVNNSSFDSIKIKVFRNNSLYSTSSSKLKFNNSIAVFDLSTTINSELAEYKIQIYLDNQLKATADSLVSGDVYLINGQSNSHPNGNTTYRNEYWRSFGKHTGYDNYSAADTNWGLAVGYGWTYTYFGVGAWGIELQRLISSNFQIPVCILNGGSGGSSIEYNLPKLSNKTDLTTTYGRLLYRAQKAKLDKNIKAIIWHQGESNSSSVFTTYDYNFNILQSNWKIDYPGLKKIYVFQIHPGCGGENQNEIREIQRKFPNKYQNVSIMSTMALDGHDGCHYTNAGYNQMALWIYRLIARDFYNSSDTLNINPPDIIRAYYLNKQNTMIGLDFTENVNIQTIFNSYNLKDYFYLNGSYGNVTSVYSANSKSAILNLNTASTANKITYLPNMYYIGSNSLVYQGPWIINPRGIGALSFYNLDIKPAAAFILQPNSRNYCNSNSNVSFTVSTQGEINGIQWQKFNINSNTWVNLPNSTSENLKFSLNDINFGPGKYRCVAYPIRNIAPFEIYSDEAEIKLFTVPSNITLKINNKKDIYCSKDTCTFDISTNGSIEKYYIMKQVNSDLIIIDSIDNQYQASCKYKLKLKPEYSGKFLIKGKIPGECNSGNINSNKELINVNSISLSTDRTSFVECIGNSLELNLKVFGNPEKIQWFKDGKEIEEKSNITATTKDLLLKNIDKTTEGNYVCRVIGMGCGIENAEYSETINVKVVSDYKIISENIKSEYNLNEDAELEVLTNNLSNTTFQWYSNDALIKDDNKYFGATTNKLKIKSLNNNDFYRTYKVISFSNSCKDTSNNFNLKRAGSSLTIKNSLNSIKTCINSDTTIIIDYEAINCDSLSFIWYFNDSLIKNSSKYKISNSAISIKNISVNDIGNYFLEIIAQPGKITKISEGVKLFASDLPQIENSSKSLEASIGDKIIIYVNAKSNDSLFYKWLKNGNVLSGQNNNSIEFNSISQDDFGDYLCEISNSCFTISTERIIISNKDLSSVDEDSNKIEISPNPANDFLFITSKSFLNEILIYNNIGEFMNVNIESTNSNAKIDISGFTPGLYMIRINKNNYYSFIKF